VIDVQDNVLRFFVIDHVLVMVSLVTIVTTGAIFSIKFTKNRLAAGLRPDPLGELERSPRYLSRKTGGLLLRGGEGRERDRMGGEWRGREGRGKDETGKEGRGGKGGQRREGGRGRVGEGRGRRRKRGEGPP